MALEAHVARGVDVVDDDVPAMLVERDFGAEEIQLGNLGDDVDDAFKFGDVDELGVERGEGGVGEHHVRRHRLARRRQQGKVGDRVPEEKTELCQNIFSTVPNLMFDLTFQLYPQGFQP